MDETKYKRWQALHRQAVTGDPLNEAERVEYEAVCREMDAEENLDGDLPRLRELRQKTVEADAEKQLPNSVSICSCVGLLRSMRASVVCSPFPCASSNASASNNSIVP